VIILMWRCARGASAAVQSAKQGIEHFHSQFNDGKFEDIYNGATEQFRSSTTKDQLLEFLSSVQRKLGRVVATGDPAYFINASTNGTFVTLTCQTDFVRGKAQERFVWILHGGRAELIGYHIESRDLIVK
jgi:hypothetical protein